MPRRDQVAPAAEKFPISTTSPKSRRKPFRVGTFGSASGRSVCLRLISVDVGRADDILIEVHFHDLRHAAGTIATLQGATMREVMSRLGHSTTSATIRYQKAAADRDRALAERLDDLVDRLRTPTNDSDSDPEPAQDAAGAAGFRGALG